MQLLGITWALAVLVGAAGIGKLVDPRHTAGALEAIGLPKQLWVVRSLGAVEVAIGGAVIGWGGVIATALLAALYGAFAVFVVVAIQSDSPLSSCGCFGRPDTPPGSAHLIVNVAAMAVLAGLAMNGGASGLSLLTLDAAPVVLSGLVLSYLLYVMMSVRPRSIA